MVSISIENEELLELLERASASTYFDASERDTLQECLERRFIPIQIMQKLLKYIPFDENAINLRVCLKGCKLTFPVHKESNEVPSIIPLFQCIISFFSHRKN